MYRKKIGLIALGIIGLIAYVMFLSAPITVIGSGAQPEKSYTIDLQDNDNDLAAAPSYRSFNTKYWNNNTFPIVAYIVFYADFRNTTDWFIVNANVNGTNNVAISYLGDSVNVGLNYYDSFTLLIPAESSYMIATSGNAHQGIQQWYEWNMTIKQV